MKILNFSPGKLDYKVLAIYAVKHMRTALLSFLLVGSLVGLSNEGLSSPVASQTQSDAELQRLRSQALQGDVDAAIDLAWIYSFGESYWSIPISDVDEELALFFATKALESGTARGASVYALFLLAGYGEGGAEKALELASFAAEEKDELGLYVLAQIFRTGDVVRRDFLKERELLLELIEMNPSKETFIGFGNGQLEYRLGWNYMALDANVTQDLSKAEAYLIDALEKGQWDPFVPLVNLYRFGGEDFEARPERSIFWLDRCINRMQENLDIEVPIVDSPYHRANCSFLKAEVISQLPTSLALPDEEKSQLKLEVVGLYENSFDVLNDGVVASLIGEFYRTGRLAKPEYDKAILWYERALELSNPSAAGFLGNMYFFGEGVERDTEKAISYHEKAAKLGNPVSAFFLYEQYFSGNRVERDLNRAYDFLVHAVRIGTDRTYPLTLANHLEDGSFGQPSLSEAKRWLEVALSLTYDPDERYTLGERLADLELTIDSPAIDGGSSFAFGSYKALIVGNSEYHHLKRLKTARNDARDLASTLSEKFGFETEVLLDATRSRILDQLISYREKLEPTDNFLLFYAGHGTIQNVTSNGFWQPIDAREDYETDWISVDLVSNIIASFNVGNVLVIADSCYSGSIFRDGSGSGGSGQSRPQDYVQRMLEKKTRVALTSGGLEPVLDSFVTNQRNSLFADALLSALDRVESTALGRDLFLDISEEVIQRSLMRGVEQTPEYSGLNLAGHEGGDFVFRKDL